MILLWDSSAMTVELTLIGDTDEHTVTWEADRSLARDILTFLRDQLAERGATFQDITGIGVFQGPGSYTGLRIGLAVFNTLATDRQIPIVGATGQQWREICRQRLTAGENDQIVLPEYGGEAHITKPRK